MAGRCASKSSAASISLDPRTWRVGSLDSATNEKLAALVFERLVALDNYGRFQPVLATEWSHDVSSKRWQFTIRPGVKFSDGTALTAADAVAALQPLLPATEQISASGNIVVIQSAAPVRLTFSSSSLPGATLFIASCRTARLWGLDLLFWEKRQ